MNTTKAPRRSLLLVDDEESILSALTRLLRLDGYAILRATSGEKALELLKTNRVGVIVSDYRMPGMTGVEFLRQVKARNPDTVRIILSGYTDLDAVTSAINEGAVFKFLTKPWESEQLREAILEAFKLFELRDENERLTGELIESQQALETRAIESAHSADTRLALLQAQQDLLASLPVAVLAIGSDGVIALTNRMAEQMFRGMEPASLVGSLANERLPDELQHAIADCQNNATRAGHWHVGEFQYHCFRWSAAGINGGVILTALPAPDTPGVSS